MRLDAPVDGLPMATGIDAEMLERMARIARDLPGRTVSLDSEEAFQAPPDSEPVLKIDGVVADEILERCYDDFDDLLVLGGPGVRSEFEGRPDRDAHAAVSSG